MKKNNILILIYIVLFSYCSIAQSTEQSNLKKAAVNNGLSFEKEAEYRFVDSSYTDIIQLFNLSDKIQALQFRILMNKSPDDNTILIFDDIQKGSDLSDPSWLLEFNVIKGPTQKNGASNDEIFVLLYNANQNGGLMPGSYKNLFKVNYSIPDLPSFQKEIKSSMKISKAEASTFEGVAIDIKSGKDELIIYAKKK